MTAEEIVKLEQPKHVKVYGLKKTGMKNSDIAKALGTNPGHVYNVLKDYACKPEKAAAADAVCQ